MGSPVDASHSRTLLSLMYPSPLHDAMTLPFGEKTTQLTRSEWPVNVDFTNPVSASHTTTSFSSARASLRPHFEYETLRTAARARIVNRQRCELGLFSQ